MMCTAWGVAVPLERGIGHLDAADELALGLRERDHAADLLLQMIHVGGCVRREEADLHKNSPI
jgi:hypothetical protein